MLTNESIASEWSQLQGEYLSRIGRAGDMIWLGFGNNIEIMIKNKPRTVAQYALHVQCPWRIVSDVEIIVASGDFYDPPEGDGSADFEWDRPGANRFDVQAAWLNTLLVNHDVIVKKAILDPHGGIRVQLEKDFCIEVFPHLSIKSEFWRLIKFNKEADKDRHLVVYEED